MSHKKCFSYCTGGKAESDRKRDQRERVQSGREQADRVRRRPLPPDRGRPQLHAAAGHRARPEALQLPLHALQLQRAPAQRRPVQHLLLLPDPHRNADHHLQL